MNLIELSKIYVKTDKEQLHSYFSRVYEDILAPHKIYFKKICEIGVGDYDCLRIFKNYFENAELLGLDIQNKNLQLEDRIFLEHFDQSNKEIVEEKSKKMTEYDLIIHDGSHVMFDQQITFCNFFNNSLKSKGIFIIEDLHTSLYVLNDLNKHVYYGNKNEITTLDLLKNFNDTGKINSDFLSKEECSILENNIEKIMIFDELSDSIVAVIYKK